MGKKDIVPGHASLEDFWYWINERHQIYRRRVVCALPKPWSEDPIFLDYKFTNVFRELDRGTIALRRMIERGVETNDPEPWLVIFNVIWYRLFNRAEHATNIGFVTSLDTLFEKLRDLERRDEPVFTNAHLTVGIAGEAKLDSYERACLNLWRACREHKLERFFGVGTMEAVWEALQDYECIGGFIAYEMVSDFRHYPTLWTPREYPSDLLTWANLGPGCKRGLLRLGLPFEQASLKWLYDLAYDATAFPLVVDGTKYEWETDQPAGLEPHVLRHHVKQALWNSEKCPFPWFELREIEHSLCEFDKYQRVKTGVGKPRQRYEGRP